MSERPADILIDQRQQVPGISDATLLRFESDALVAYAHHQTDIAEAEVERFLAEADRTFKKISSVIVREQLMEANRGLILPYPDPHEEFPMYHSRMVDKVKEFKRGEV